MILRKHIRLAVTRSLLRGPQEPQPLGPSSVLGVRLAAAAERPPPPSIALRCRNSSGRRRQPDMRIRSSHPPPATTKTIAAAAAARIAETLRPARFARRRSRPRHHAGLTMSSRATPDFTRSSIPSGAGSDAIRRSVFSASIAPAFRSRSFCS